MDRRVKFKIEYDHDARDGIEIERRGRDEFKVKVTKDIDLANDEDAIEVFHNKFNYAYNGSDFKAPPVLGKNDRRQQIELKRLQEALLKGEDRYNFKLHSH